MKVLSVLLLSSVSVLAAPPMPNMTWGLTWDQPTNMPVLASYVPGTNQAYKLYGTASVGMPVANYPLLTVFTNWTLVTNGSSILLSNNITLPFTQQFFFINPTNIFGEPLFSLGFGATLTTGPPWSTVTGSTLSRQGP